MDDRFIAALAIIAIMAVVSMWLLTKKTMQRRAFLYRQTGRGKDRNQL